MDILESLFHDIRTINSNIKAQDVQLAKALKGYEKQSTKGSMSKAKLTKSRGVLPSLPPQRVTSKSKLASKPSLKKLISAKSKGSMMNKSKSSKIMAKKKPKLPSQSSKIHFQKPPTNRNGNTYGTSSKKEPLPRGARPTPKRSLVPSKSGAYASTSLTPAPPVTKKPPTLTDSDTPVHKFRAEFRQHLADIEKMKNLMTDSSEENEVLQEMNGVVSMLLNKSQSYLTRADYTLRTANAEAPSHYKNILRKLLDNQSKTTIVMSPKPVARKVPIYKKMHVQYTDGTKKDLDDLLMKHPRVVGIAEGMNAREASALSEFNFPDIFDRIYSKPLDSKKKAASEKEFDLSSFSSAKLIERAQKSLSSAVSSESINNYKREASGLLSPTKSGNIHEDETFSSQFSPKAPLRVEVELDAMVKDVIEKAASHSPRKFLSLTALSAKDLKQKTSAEIESSINLSSVSPLVISTSNLPESEQSVFSSEMPFTGSITQTPTKYPSLFPSIDEDLAMLTPSLFDQRPTRTHEEKAEEQENESKELAFEMELIRNSNQHERERIQNQMSEMRSRLDNLLNPGASSVGMNPKTSSDNKSQLSIEDLNIEELLPKLAKSNLQKHDNEAKLSEHEDLLQKVLKALAKKSSKEGGDKNGRKGESKDKSERKINRQASKLVALLTQQGSDQDNTSGSLSSEKEESFNEMKDSESNVSSINENGNCGNSTHWTPAPPPQGGAPSSQTPRTKKLAKAISLSTMHEVENENDEDSEMNRSNVSRKHNKKVFGSSRPTEKSLASVEAIKERAKNFDATRPTEVDMKF